MARPRRGVLLVLVTEHGEPVGIATGEAHHRGAPQIVGPDGGARRVAHRSLALPRSPEWISPLLAILPAQLFTYHLTKARGQDTEKPRGLSKITETL